MLTYQNAEQLEKSGGHLGGPNQRLGSESTQRGGTAVVIKEALKYPTLHLNKNKTLDRGEDGGFQGQVNSREETGLN